MAFVNFERSTWCVGGNFKYDFLYWNRKSVMSHHKNKVKCLLMTFIFNYHKLIRSMMIKYLVCPCAFLSAIGIFLSIDLAVTIYFVSPIYSVAGYDTRLENDFEFPNDSNIYVFIITRNNFIRYNTPFKYDTMLLVIIGSLFGYFAASKILILMLYYYVYSWIYSHT